jgi:uncharacterized protein YjiS (DUF1127 family)
MIMDFRENMTLLRTLANDYYCNRVSFLEYREQRSQLLKMIDEDLNGVKIESQKEDNNESIFNKALSFLKIDKLREIN